MEIVDESEYFIKPLSTQFLLSELQQRRECTCKQVFIHVNCDVSAKFHRDESRWSQQMNSDPIKVVFEVDISYEVDISSSGNMKAFDHSLPR